MMSYIVRWLTGLTFAIISIEESLSICTAKCSIFEINENKGIDCSKRNITRVPSLEDLCLTNSTDIEYLDISYNQNIELHDADLTLYPALTVLKMAWLVNVSYFSGYFFEPLVDIENLTLDGLHLHDDSGAIGRMFPGHLLNLFVNYCEITKIDFSHMEFLTTFYAAYNNLTYFPNIPKDAPLMEIDLRRNPLNDLRYVDLAPFCLLTYLAIELPEHSELNTSAKYFECCQLEMWIKDNKVNGTVSLNCTRTYEDEECAFQETTARLLALKEREDCLIRNELIDNYNFWVYFMDAIIGVILVLVMSLVVFRYYNKRKASQMEADDQED